MSLLPLYPGLQYNRKIWILYIMDDLKLLNEIERASGENISACYQCFRCTNGCPVAEEMDILPHRVIRYIILGDRDKILKSKAIWTCLQCVTCSVRCPNGIDIAHVFDILRNLSAKEHCEADKDTWLFDNLFLESVKKHGRLNEMETIMRYKIAKKDLFSDAKMGIGMFMKGRMGILPHNVKNRDEIKEIFSKAETVKGRR
jgi:heterodisulfide reductase subunit C